MTTQKQIAANRRNAQLSTGPKSAEGKEIVSRNAITHGLTASRAVVLPEEEQDFARFRAALEEEWLPQGATEKLHFERALLCGWRLKRMARIETSVLLAHCHKQSSGDPELALGQAAAAALPVCDSLARHERQIEKSLRTALRELELAQYARITDVHTYYARNLGKFSTPGEKRRPEGGRRRESR